MCGDSYHKVRVSNHPKKNSMRVAENFESWLCWLITPLFYCTYLLSVIKLGVVLRHWQKKTTHAKYYTGRYPCYIFSQGYSLHFSLIFAHLWWFRFGVLGLESYVGFLGLGFQLMVFGVCGVGPSGFFWVGALYINIEE